MKDEVYIERIKENVKKVNEGFNKLDAAAVKGEIDLGDGFIENQLSKYRVLTGTKSYLEVETGDLSAYSSEQLRDLDAQLKMTLSSKWMTVEGRKEIFEKRRQTFAASGFDFSEDDMRTLGKLLNSDEVEKLIEEGVLSSEQVVSIVNDADNNEDIAEAIQAVTRGLGRRVNKVSKGTAFELVRAAIKSREDYGRSFDNVTKAVGKIRRYKNLKQGTANDLTELFEDVLQHKFYQRTTRLMKKLR